MNGRRGTGHGAGRFFGPGRNRAGHAHLDAAHPAGTCTLDALRGGDEVEIVGVDDPGARMHALRFGMAEGSQARCVTRIPAGPIVMRSGRQEIAVGRKLAQRIRVRRIDAGDVKKAG